MKTDAEIDQKREAQRKFLEQCANNSLRNYQAALNAPQKGRWDESGQGRFDPEAREAPPPPTKSSRADFEHFMGQATRFEF